MSLFSIRTDSGISECLTGLLMAGKYLARTIGTGSDIRVFPESYTWNTTAVKSCLSSRPRWWWRSSNNSRVSSSDMSNRVASQSLAFPIANGIRIFSEADINHFPNSSSSVDDSIIAPSLSTWHVHRLRLPHHTEQHSVHMWTRVPMWPSPKKWQRAGHEREELAGIPLFYEVIVLPPTPPFSARSNCTNWHEFFSWFTCSLDVQFFYKLIREQRSWLVTTNRGSIHPLPLHSWTAAAAAAVSFFCWGWARVNW